MKKATITVKAVIGLTAMAAVFSACQKENLPTGTPAVVNESSKNITSDAGTPTLIDNQYIVRLKDSFGTSLLDGVLDFDTRNQLLLTQIQGLLAPLGLQNTELIAVYNTVFKGFTIKLSNPAQLKVLELLDVVVSVEQDQMMSVQGFPDNKGAGMENAKAQTINYGVVRTGSASGAGLDRKAWVIDTGIDLDHPDLNVNRTLSKSFLSSSGGGLLGLGGSSTPPSPDDQNGHGTHCAGIIGAKDNTIGSKGVAFGAEVVAIQVLGSNGSGATSGIIAGVDYVAANAKLGDVANMSLGGGANTSLDNAVKNAAAKGIWFVVAAGNDSRLATNSSPARANGPFLYTISSCDSQNRLSSFSNYGNPPVDFAEPGTSIYSTYRNGGYSTLSGTSMAAPHAAGLILLRAAAPADGGRITGDKDATPDVIGVK